MRVVRRTSYAQDLDRIVDHIAEDNPSAALDMWDEIERQVQRLRDFPHSGRAGRIPETRELVVTGTPFIVIYMVGENVEVIRVLHGAQKCMARQFGWEGATIRMTR
ncbi:type II toxin-antitoxin system RelE/ParE family toxin [Sinorhizobium meliloti]|nr:type II toxin-antitoxin system RelE/ParE family toxin [Sinorhizobium meliloti]ARS65937.1 addiction module toxin RelE [Sinorhizobium meliloti RU11/001]RVG76809.1 type II toxin-antitoxin system RelE/ParE family toxin [Sinorhizobium meliloti]RVH49588.1 type II toxin-antitoxin system RelE/ParE family toxin [Sinorhizobium meliloti]